MKMGRRNVLALPGLAWLAPSAVAAASKPDAGVRKPAESESEDISGSIATFAVETAFADLPAAAVHAGKRSILDAIGVSLAASKLEPACEPFSALALAEGGAAQATILGRTIKVPAAHAALANGALAHALDYEDVHDASGMHPNAVVVPAALAAAEALGGISGRDYLTAVAIGCDLACRLGLAREANLNKYGWYFPPIAGAFGATAAVGRLYGLDRQQMLAAISLTLCQTSCSSELINNPQTHVRAIRDSFPAATAIRSVQLAKAGIEGFAHPFEGRFGFATMYAHGAYRFDVLTDRLGRHFYGAEVSYKAWPACRGSHQYIQAALRARDDFGVDPRQIGAIDVLVRPLDEMLCVPEASKRAPSTAIDAKFSIPFTIATSLVDGEVTLGSFDDEALVNPAVLEVAARVTHRVGPEQLDNLPILTVTTKDDRRREYSSAHLLGSPENPVSDDYLTRKFLDCCAYADAQPGLDAGQLAETILAIETLPDMRSLL